MEQDHSITQLLVAWGHGDRTALDQLTPRVHRELHAIARAYLNRARPNQSLQPTALINEAFIRLIDQSHPMHLENRTHFYGNAARLMRFVLVDYIRTHQAEKRGGGLANVQLEEVPPVGQASLSPDVLEVDEALTRLAEVDERKAKVIELRYFGGLSREEIASALKLTLPTVKRDLRLGEAWLRRFLSSGSV